MPSSPISITHSTPEPSRHGDRRIISYLESMKRRSEPEIRRDSAALDPAIKSWLDNVLVPAMVRKWIRADAVGAPAITEDPPPRTDSKIPKSYNPPAV